MKPRAVLASLACLAACAVLAGGAGCGDDPGAAPSPPGAEAGASEAGDDGGANPAGWTFTTLRDLTLSANGNAARVELVRADRPDGGRSFLLYQHATGGHAPVAIQTEPYAGIDWSGEANDARWAALGAGSHPDTDAPAFNGTDLASYAPQTPQQVVENDLIWAVNGFGSIRAYGRFYTGGTVEDDVLDAVAPYVFATTRPDEIDVTRLGVFGGSWGAMMALFGASRAPTVARPRAVVAISPPSDFVDLYGWATTMPGQASNAAAATAFFSPYLRRMAPTLGAPPAGDRAAPFTHAGLCPTLTGDVLVAHDAWDTLIPITESEAFVKACPKVQGLWWHRAGAVSLAPAALDHGPSSAEGDIPTIYALTYAHLVLQLAPETTPTLYSLASQSALVVHLRLVLAELKAGGDVGYVVPRLRELTSPRLQLLQPSSGELVPGAKLVAGAVNEVWGTSFDEAGIRTQLETGLPAPP